MRTLYDVLGVRKDASLKEIKKSYRSLCKIHHPDNNGDLEDFREISSAYEILSDPILRAEYDSLIQKDYPQDKESNRDPYLRNIKCVVCNRIIQIEGYGTFKCPCGYKFDLLEKQTSTDAIEKVRCPYCKNVQPADYYGNHYCISCTKKFVFNEPEQYIKIKCPYCSNTQIADLKRINFRCLNCNKILTFREEKKTLKIRINKSDLIIWKFILVAAILGLLWVAINEIFYI